MLDVVTIVMLYRPYIIIMMMFSMYTWIYITRTLHLLHISYELNTATCDTQYDTNKECIAPNTCTFMTRYLKSMLGMGQEKISTSCYACSGYS